MYHRLPAGEGLGHRGTRVAVQIDQHVHVHVGRIVDQPRAVAPDDLDAMDAGAPPDEEEEPMMQEAIMNEVAKRVAARLRQKQSKEDMVDALSERIMKRLTSK